MQFEKESDRVALESTWHSERVKPPQMSPQICLNALITKIKETGNISAPAKAHDSPLSQGLNKTPGSNCKGVPSSCFGKYWIKLIWKCRSILSITVAINYNTRQQNCNFSFKTYDLPFCRSSFMCLFSFYTLWFFLRMNLKSKKAFICQVLIAAHFVKHSFLKEAGRNWLLCGNSW